MSMPFLLGNSLLSGGETPAQYAASPSVYAAQAEPVSNAAANAVIAANPTTPAGTALIPAATVAPIAVAGTDTVAAPTSTAPSVATSTAAEPAVPGAATAPANTDAGTTTVGTALTSATGDTVGGSGISDDELSSILNALNYQQGAYGGGIYGDDTALPSPTAADIEALQPTPVAGSTTSPIWIFVLVGMIIGAYVYWRHMHKKGAHTAPATHGDNDG